jgi:signal transduction histidine kinase
VLSAMAVLFLPRQFQVAVVENVNEAHLKRAAWLFPLYLLLINIFVLPIALGGLLHFAGQGVDADTFVLTLPMSQRQEGLALLVFIGGLSAATGMVIVETIALSTMVCNDLVMPLLLRHKGSARRVEGPLRSAARHPARRDRRHPAARLLLLPAGGRGLRAGRHRPDQLLGRGPVCAGDDRRHVLARRNARRRPGRSVGGFLVWAYTLLLPSFAKSGWLPGGLPDAGAVRDRAAAAAAAVRSDRHRRDLALPVLEFPRQYRRLCRRLAVAAADGCRGDAGDGLRRRAEGDRTDRAVLWRGRAKVSDLQELVGRFLGPTRAQVAFAGYARRHGVASGDMLEADAQLVQFAESLLAGAIGSASARVMVASVAKEEPLSIDEVMHILDEASQLRTYSRELERKSRELTAATLELQEANERLQELDRVKDDIMSSVTHELRTPLTSIRAFSELLRDDPKMHLADRERFLGLIVSEAERLTRLINQTLDLAKIESGRADWNGCELDLKEVIEQSVAATSQLFREKEAHVELDLPDNLPLILADRDRLIQVMLNLLSNAVKFLTPGSGRVRVMLRLLADGLEVSVADNGPGIRPEDQELIFEKFRQVGDTMTAKPSGTGLGLPISRRIVEHFGGRLWVESVPGEGATFRFTLPFAPVQEPGVLRRLQAG